MEKSLAGPLMRLALGANQDQSGCSIAGKCVASVWEQAKLGQFTAHAGMRESQSRMQVWPW